MRKPATAWQRAKKFGVDMSLLRYNLERTPTERIQGLMQSMGLLHQLTTARTHLHAKPQRFARRPARPRR